MVWRGRHTPQTVHVDNWITCEFTVRGLAPPDCTPAALARALERERHITIEFRPLASDDPGVYGMLYRPAGCPDTAIIVYRPTHSLVLHRLIMFHELAHLLFDHALTDVAGIGVLCGYMVSDKDDATAEAFAMGAMQYSFLDADPASAPADAADDVSASAFGQFLKRTQYTS